ncbi:hypothetical protein GJAV_G00057720 [Gymnothorax javanicus]|nr:hypothetical protein GJAV_G00057720 [Gymnothorax javanicus]
MHVPRSSNKNPRGLNQPDPVTRSAPQLLGWICRTRRHSRSGGPAREEDTNRGFDEIWTQAPSQNVLAWTPDSLDTVYLDLVAPSPSSLTPDPGTM